MSENVLEIRNLQKHFPLIRGILSRTVGYVKAIDGVDLTIRRGETLGVVGESGCGKTTLGWLILNLLEPTAGEVLFDGINVNRYDQKILRRRMQVIFQDPYSSLDPRMTVEQIIAEPLVIHKLGNSKDRRDRVIELLALVGLRPEHSRLYPHEFSGGQRQRIGIARALALKPEVIICDEPISALDVSIQSQILNLLADLQERFDLTYVFISHDLRVVEHVSDRIVVMYLGRIVEIGTSIELDHNPYHPYSEALLSSRPVPDPSAAKRNVVMEGDVPSPINPPPGCHFASRCQYSLERCQQDPPPRLEEILPGRWARCWRVREIRNLG